MSPRNPRAVQAMANVLKEMGTGLVLCFDTTSARGSSDLLSEVLKPKSTEPRYSVDIGDENASSIKDEKVLALQKPSVG